MKISINKRRTAAIKKFEEAEWPISDKQHYGTKDVDFKIYPFCLSAKEGKEIIGAMEGKIQGGVCTINDLIVAHSKRGQGFGKKLMAAIEKYATENNAHKVRLITGVGWPAVKFYEKLGYEETGRRLDDMMHVDFIEFTKFFS